jgi:hypothetical protein
MNVMAREYRIAHQSLLLDFDITIQVENTFSPGDLAPTQVHYDGQWDIPFKQKEVVKFYLSYSDWSLAP